MQITEKSQVTIRKRLREAGGVFPGTEIVFSLEGANIVIRKVSTGIDDRRNALRAAAAKVRKSLDVSFQQMDSEDIMSFLRPDDDDRP
jgi:bifunctional DNA-binding transcriptional regulator/antitoxin component of YhaV-PrlF toxin-antitoxin module